jgi:glycosyltransferase involved in cell wall biosynthesis
MQALDLLIVNSTAEPFGLVIVEAMACGTSVLAASVDGIPEIIQHGVNGWLVPPGDERLLSEAIVHLSSQPKLRSRMAKQGKQHVASRFAADRYMFELRAFYQSVAQPSAEPRPTTVSPEATRKADSAKFA